MQQFLQVHVDAFAGKKAADFQRHLKTVTAAPGAPSSLASLCAIWHTAKPWVSLIEAFPFIPAAEKNVMVALQTQLDAICATTGLAKADMGSVMTTLCTTWQPAKALIPLIMQLPGAANVPIVGTIVNGFTAAMNAICAPPSPQAA